MHSLEGDKEPEEHLENIPGRGFYKYKRPEIQSVPGMFKKSQGVQCVWKGSCERGVLGDKVGDGASALTLENAEQREANP